MISLPTVANVKYGTYGLALSCSRMIFDSLPDPFFFLPGDSRLKFFWTFRKLYQSQTLEHDRVSFPYCAFNP